MYIVKAQPQTEKHKKTVRVIHRYENDLHGKIAHAEELAKVSKADIISIKEIKLQDIENITLFSTVSS